MKILTKHTDYALAALGVMVEQRDESVTVADLAQRLGIPYPFLRGVFQKLSKAGLVQSFRGQGGGYRLTRKPERITVGDVMEVFQGPLEFTQCWVRDEKCPRRNRCTVRKKLKSLEQLFKQELSDCTLAELSPID